MRKAGGEQALRSVVNLGVGMPAALAGQFFSHLGAGVSRVRPEAGDPFETVYPAYGVWRRAETAASADDLESLLAEADVAIIGGEDYPGLDVDFDADAIAARHPHLVVLSLTGYATADAAERPAVDLLVQARTGLVYEEFSDRPLAFALPAPSYGAALVGVMGALAALVEREKSGRGQVVRTSMQQGVALWGCGIWTLPEKPDDDFWRGSPKDVQQPIFRCADGKYLMLMVGTPGALHGIYKALGVDIEVDPKERTLPDLGRGPRDYFLVRSIVEPYFAKRPRDEVLAALWREGVAAEAVLPAGAVWDEEQTAASALIERLPDGGRAVGSPLLFQSLPTPPDTPVAELRDGARQGPISGLQVIDLGSFVAGPLVGKLLADLGADVVKVEPPTGDFFRVMYRNFASVTRGKRSLALDMKAPDGLHLLHRICAGADAVIHNMRVGVAERLGVGAADLRARNPDVVTLHLSGFGPSGPKVLSPGLDPILQPYCGHSIRAGGEGADPLVYQVPVLDFGAGAIGAIGVLAAILQRKSAGAVDVHASLLATGVYFLSELVQRPDGGFVGAPLMDADKTGFHPAERLYRAADGWIAVAARTEPMAQAFARVLGLALGPRADWDGPDAARLAEAIGQRPAKSLLAELEAAGVWAEPCTREPWAALCANESARQLGLVADGHDARYGRINGVGQMMSFSRSALGRDLPPIPALGEHSREIASAAGLSGEAIDDLYGRQVIA